MPPAPPPEDEQAVNPETKQTASTSRGNRKRRRKRRTTGKSTMTHKAGRDFQSPLERGWAADEAWVVLIRRVTLAVPLAETGMLDALNAQAA